jgi:membrane protein DedA with SNARE-associated domain
MSDSSRTPWLLFAVFASALVIWAGLFALGAYLESGADRPEHDLRKPLIIIATMAAFLSVWGLALVLRAWRTRKKK